MIRFFSEYRDFWTKERKRSLVYAAILLLLSLVIQFLAARHSSIVASNSTVAGDLLLDNLPTLDLDFLIVEFALILWIGITLFLFARPRYLLFGVKAIALFVLIRSFTINLTHLGIYPTTLLDSGDPGYGLYSLFAFQGNYFFSGHTGLPFLMAMVFYNNKLLRYFFFFLSFIFGIAVLFAHVHYSIDVFAAPFLAYGIYKIAEKLFPRDHALTMAPEENKLVIG